MIPVRQILENKGYQVWHISPQSTILEALRELAARNVGALLVLEGEQPAGILSERDLVRKLDLEGRSPETTKVRELMSSPVICVSPSDTVTQCMQIMTERRVRHLPVVEEERVIGIISIGDVVKTVIAQQEFLIEQLEKYIRGV